MGGVKAHGMVPEVFLVLTLTVPTATLAEPNYMLCSREPYAAVVGKTYSSTRNVCDASAKIQSIAYECGVPEESYDFKTKNIKGNFRAALRACKDFCEDIDSDCGGQLSEAFTCGFSIPVEKEVTVGREIIDCPSRCRGQAFHYCSIYHGSYFGFDEQLFKKMPDNCSCYWKD